MNMLSPSQKDALDRMRRNKGQLPILDIGVNTAAALTSRGLIDMHWARRVDDKSYYYLTNAGKALASALPDLDDNPTFYEVRNTIRKKNQRWRKGRGQKT